MFGNVPAFDKTTVTLVGGASYSFTNGVEVHGSVSHDVFDSAYKSTQARLGFSMPFLLPGSATSAR